ncbi:hypothetical protein [Leucobacter chromiiresistens]|uniref:DUF7882 family protein n=1 Tax=Leucobacter chromiiresistens TaxID=1079994 RepID=UPI001E4108A4|nr:hypothetical protein [Leucobacter chromiiresistens]
MHLQIVIQQKLAKQEHFFFTWHPSGRPDNEMTIWVSPHVHLGFRYSGSRHPKTSKAWLVALNAISYSPRGLIAVGEEEAARYLRENPGVR